MPDLREALENSKRPTWICGLRIEEVSGVDAAANLAEGWSVMKARASGSRIVLKREPLNYTVQKSTKEQRYTFGLLYSASSKDDVVLDAHGEAIKAEDLQKAQWEYVRTGDRSIHLQHGLTEAGLAKIGEWTDIVTWPYAVETEFTLPNGKVQKARIPANSVWLGVVWTPEGWQLVRNGTITGFSLGGWRKKSEEKTMVKQEEPKDPLSGYTLRPFQKAMPDDSPSPTNTGDADRPLTAPVAPVEDPDQFSYPQVDPKLIDHKPRLNQRLKDFLASFETKLRADNYRKLLEITIEFAKREAVAELQEDHIANSLWFAAELRKVLPSESDQVATLKHFVPAKVLKGFALKGMTNPGSLANVVNNAMRKLNEHNLSGDFKEQTDPLENLNLGDV